MKTIKFAKHYSKLDEFSFTTIRDHDKQIFDNDIVCIKSPTKMFKSVCFASQKVKFKDISIDVLMNDLGIFNTGIDLLPHDYCLNELRKIYPNLTVDDTVFVYYFKKVQ